MVLNHLVDLVLAAAGSWSAECAALFFIPFLHEDVAIIGGALLIAGHRLPVGLVLSSLYAGMVVSDFLLYGLGAAARRNRLARRLLISPRVRQLGAWLTRHMTPIVLVARLVPGLMFPTYVACGWFGLSLMRFSLATMAMAATYLPVMLSVYLLFGQAAITRIGSWAWLALLIPLLAGALLRWRPPFGRLLRGRLLRGRLLFGWRLPGGVLVRRLLAPLAAWAGRGRDLIPPVLLPQPIAERVRERYRPDRRPGDSD